MSACMTNQDVRLIALVNQHRAMHRLPPLRPSAILMESALAHAVDMADNDYFSHTSRDGRSHTDRAHALGYDRNTWVGGNILYGQPDAEAAFLAWKNSPEHNANMLGASYQEIGVTVAVEPAWSFANDVYLVASMELGTGQSLQARTCNGDEPDLPLPSRPIPRPPATHLPKDGPDRVERKAARKAVRRQTREGEALIDRLVRRLGVRP